LLDVANKKEGFNLVMKMTLDALMQSERKIFQEDNSDYSNGYRPRCVQGFGKELVKESLSSLKIIIDVDFTTF
jgi:hypothetical protein